MTGGSPRPGPRRGLGLGGVWGRAQKIFRFFAASAGCYADTRPRVASVTSFLRFDLGLQLAIASRFAIHFSYIKTFGHDLFGILKIFLRRRIIHDENPRIAITL